MPDDGIVVGGSEKREDAVQFQDVPERLSQRLGGQATIGLLDLMKSAEKDWSVRVVASANDRFECRLAQELSALRVDMAQAMANLGRDLRQEMATNRVELLKWSFLFWVGQLAGVAGLLAFMLRISGR